MFTIVCHYFTLCHDKIFVLVGTRAVINPGNGTNDAGDKASDEENVASPVIHQDVWCPDV